MQTEPSVFHPLFHRVLFAAVTICAIVGSMAFAQESTEEHPDMLEVLPPSLNIQNKGEQKSDNSSLLIRRLLDEVKQSRTQLRQSEGNVLPPAEIDQLRLDDGKTRVFTDIDDQIRNWDKDRKQRVSIIRMKVRQLSELLKQRAQHQTSEAKSPPTEKTVPKPVAPTPPETPGSSVEPAEKQPAEDQQPEDVPPEEPLPQPITDSAVDHLALADNLFGAGKTKLALGVYQNIKTDELTAEEQGWVLYQIGVCQRKLGDIPAAEKNLRIVAGMTTLQRLPQFARWQLDAIARLKELKARAEKTTSTIEDISARIEKQAS